MFRANFTHDIEFYYNPNLRTQTMSKQRPQCVNLSILQYCNIKGYHWSFRSPHTVQYNPSWGIGKQLLSSLCYVCVCVVFILVITKVFIRGAFHEKSKYKIDRVMHANKVTSLLYRSAYVSIYMLNNNMDTCSCKVCW